VVSETVPNFNNIKPLKMGVRIDYRLDKDVWYNSNGEERVRKVKLPYFQTHKEYDCDMLPPVS
jgi:hypothetical protein